jgi:hypothetical protein
MMQNNSLHFAKMIEWTQHPLQQALHSFSPSVLPSSDGFSLRFQPVTK